MKKIITILLSSTILSCCNKDENTTPAPSPVSQLPPATQTGANTVGCLVNGEAFLPYQSNPFGTPALTCSYQLIDSQYEFALGFGNDKLSPVRGLTILSNKLLFNEGQIYLIKQEELINSSFAYYQNGFQNVFGTNITNTGELKINKLDQSNAIISGTFWFDAIKSSGEKIEIREGRFDMKYSL